MMRYFIVNTKNSHVFIVEQRKDLMLMHFSRLPPDSEQVKNSKNNRCVLSFSFKGVCLRGGLNVTCLTGVLIFFNDDPSVSIFSFSRSSYTNTYNMSSLLSW